jgi:radical SAM protein with 4Fe4S-binding SPASM domain
MTKPSTKYGPLVWDLNARAAKIRQPVNGAFELTARCNLACRMCYVRHPVTNPAAARKELAAAEWLEIARQAKDRGMVFLLLTGGEVFLRKDFFEIYEPLTRMGFILTLFTNGTLITEEIANRLAQAPPSFTEITLYGATASTYEAITGVSGSFAACLEAIEVLRSHRIPLGLKTTISRYNIHELEDMRKIAHDRDLPFTGSWLLAKRPDGQASDAENCRLPAVECVALEATDKASATENTEAALKDTSPRNDSNFYCAAGKAAFVINPEGKMNACLHLPQPGARPLEVSFHAAWEQLGRFIDSVPPLSQECRSCEIRALCGRCPAWSLMETGSFNKPSRYWCEIAEARKERYRGQVAQV